MIWYFVIFTGVFGYLMLAYRVVHPMVAYPIAFFLSIIALSAFWLVLALGGLVIAFIYLLGAVVFSL